MVRNLLSQRTTRTILSRTRNQCGCTQIKYASGFNLKEKPVQVIYSKSTCPFENLAFEEYIYENISLERNQRLLFLWRNEPSVVVGRHQNPWLESDVELVRANNVNMCRRQSGGGTVYHDLGNMNLTFFTNRKLYKREENLAFIINALSGAYNLDLVYNKKYDILLNGKYKVSGSASKLGLKTAYHHCTLLCDTNLEAIAALLRCAFGEIDTNATQSHPSPTANLFEGSYDFLTLCKLLHQEYLKLYNPSDSFQSDLVEPSEFLSIMEQAKMARVVGKLKDWQWIYEKTPTFVIKCAVVFKDGNSCDIRLHIHKGIVSKTDFFGDASASDKVVLEFLLSRLHGVRFDYEEFVSILLSENEEDGYRVAQIK